MLPTSLSFIIFFIIIAFVYFCIPRKLQNIWLLLASYYFYAVLDARFIFLIMLSTAITYYAGLKFGNLEASKKKKIFLILAIILNLAGLVFFKYFNFLSEAIFSILNIFNFNLSGISLKLLLPIGISFYTFQNISYLVDVYYKKIQPEKNIITFSLYVSFFPKIINGPIERAKKLMPQFYKEHSFKYEDGKEGLKLILFGFFKKLVIADNLANLVDVVYSNPTGFEGWYLIIATIAFGFQLYMDFSGYTDIALGFARVLGYKLTANFNRPYFSKNPAEFWRRWHISLSVWFQDYVFIPLYMKVSRIKYLQNSSSKTKHFISFFIALFIGEILLGLWHGANWTFVLFGVYYAVIIFTYYSFRKYWEKINPYVQMFFTFILVFLAWVFFRADNVQDVYYFFSHMFNFEAISIRRLGIGLTEIIITFLSIFLIMAIEFLEEFFPESQQKLFIRYKWLKFAGYMALSLLILLFGSFNSIKFIYAQF